MQMMVLSLRVLAVEVEVDLASRWRERGLRDLPPPRPDNAEGGRLALITEPRTRPVLLPLLDSDFPIDLVRLREDLEASSSAAMCSRQQALISRAFRRGSVAYISSVFLLSLDSPPRSLLSSLVSQASLAFLRRPNVPYFSATSSFSPLGSFFLRPSVPNLVS